MAHHAKIVPTVFPTIFEVVSVLVVDESVVATLPGLWLQTSYNTYGGEHRFGGVPLRKNFAGVGYTYDAVRNAFIPPRPYESWGLNETTCLWEPPTPYPTDGGVYRWDEPTFSWVAV